MKNLFIFMSIFSFSFDAFTQSHGTGGNGPSAPGEEIYEDPIAKINDCNNILNTMANAALGESSRPVIDLSLMRSTKLRNYFEVAVAESADKIMHLTPEQISQCNNSDEVAVGSESKYKKILVQLKLFKANSCSEKLKDDLKRHKLENIEQYEEVFKGLEAFEQFTKNDMVL